MSVSLSGGVINEEIKLLSWLDENYLGKIGYAFEVNLSF